MRRSKNSQKAVTTLNHKLWNNMWQAFCPWVAGADLSPLKTAPAATRRRPRTTTWLIAFAVMAALAGNASSAQAYEYDPSLLHYASLNNKTPNDTAASRVPQLFGSGEQRHSDLRPFTKWTGVIAKFKKEFRSSANKPQVQKWMMMLGSLANASTAQKIEAVNNYMNKVAFVPDSKNYGVKDNWATPMEFMARGGDCEDYAVAKYISLRALGVPKDKMRIAIVNDEVMRMPHAVLIVYDRGQAMVLDNQNPAILNSADISRYRPIYSISQVAWWRH